MERPGFWPRALRETVAVLSLGGVLLLGCLAIVALSLVAWTNTLLATGLMALTVVYAGFAGALGYRLALRSWAWWALWAATVLTVPFVLVQLALHLDGP